MLNQKFSLLSGISAFGLACALALGACSSDTLQSHVEAGKASMAKKDHKEAVIHFKAALQKQPEAVEVRYLLGQELLDSGDPAGAVIELTRALEQKHDANKVLPALARALLLTADYKRLVLLHGETLLSDKAAQAALKTSIAAAWSALGDQRKSDTAIAAALVAVPDFGPAALLNAKFLAGRGEHSNAKALVDKILERDGTLYEAWHLKGEIEWATKDASKSADAHFRKALAIEPKYAPSHVALVFSRMTQGDMAGAKAQLEQMRQVLPRHPETMFVDAHIALIDRDFSKARELSQQLLRWAPANAGVLQLAGAVESSSGSLVMAERHLGKALQINPELPVARHLLARTYLRLGQPGRALETLQPLSKPGSTDAQALALSGLAEQQQGNAGLAEDYFSRAGKVDPKDERVQASLALTSLMRQDPSAAFAQLELLSAQSKETFVGSALVSARIKRREYDAALKAAEEMDKKKPGGAAAAELKGQIHFLRKDYAAARQAFEQALVADPNLFVATANLAAIDVLERQPEQAQKRFEGSLQRDARNYFASMALAELRSRAGAPLAEVKAILVEAIKVSPTASGPRLQLIEVTLRSRQYKDALAAAQEAAAAMPNDLKVLDAVGRAQMEAGDVEQAISTFRRIAGVDQKSALAYVRLADVYKSSGNRSAAETALRKALELEPGLLEVQSALMKHMLANNRSREVLQAARNIQQVRPTDAAGYRFEAMIHLNLKATDSALAVLRKGIAVPGSDPDLARSLYKTMLDAGRTAEADRFAAGWIKDHPRDVAFDYQMAVAAITRGDMVQAESRLRRVVDQRPEHPLALNNLAFVLAYQGKSGGVEFAQRAVNQAPDKPALLDTLAMALAVEKQMDKAISVQKLAVELAPTDTSLRFNLARLAAQGGERALARAELEKLQAMGASLPIQPQVSKLLATL